MTKINSLIWLRWQNLMANKNLIVMAFFPYILCVLYINFLDMGPEAGLSTLSVCLSMSFVFSSGQMIATTISEEKEKKNLKSLLLSGVSSVEHILSSLIIPIGFGIAAIIIMPFIANCMEQLKGNYLTYFILNMFTLMIITLVYLLVAVFSDTQAKSQINSLPIMFVVTLLPMFSETSDVLNKINEVSFMSTFNSFFIDMGKFNLINSIITLSVWIVTLLTLVLLAFNKNKTKKTKLKFSKNELVSES